MAIAAARKGYLIFPLKPDTKEPATRHGFKEATAEIEQVEAWWDENPDYNIGLACGLQPNGMFIAVVDVDAKHGGVLAWKQLTRDNGSAWQKYMPIHKTPRAGFHIIGQVDPVLALNASNGFPRGIDTRGAGGYIVLPDSRFVDTETGEIGSYVCTTNNLWNTEPGTFPDWVIDLWQEGPQRLAIERHPSARSSDGDSPLDWMKANIDWVRELERDGFTLHADFGGESRWTRPGKARGVSLSLHEAGNGCVVVWSENCPLWMTDGRCGQPTADGHWSMNGFQYICARDFGGDVRAAMSAIRREMMPPPPPPSGRAGTQAGDDDGEPDATPLTGLNLPPEFWTARPWLTHIRDSAWSVGSTPDSQLIVTLARYATMIPPGLHIPSIVRAKGSFDLMTVVVAASGQGKSSLMLRAEELLPSERKDLRFGLGLSSGEGIVEMYYGMKDVVGENFKVTKERGLVYAGVNFVVDEGSLLSSLAGRSGFTGVERLLTAWSGGTLSTANATQDRFRHVPAGQYRFTCTMAIQVELSSELWAGTRTAQGFTGRLLMMMSRGGDVPPPGQRPQDPGPLDVPTPPSMNRAITYPKSVVDEVQWNDYAKQSPTYVEDALVAHRDLQRLKLAGIMAMADGRLDVDETDWALASQIVDVSSNVRTWLQQQTAAKRRLDEAQSAETKGRTQAAVANAEHQTHVGRVARRLLTFLSKEPVLISALRQKTAKRDRPLYFTDAVESLVETGMAKSDGKSLWT
jgi:hypothetical protein